MLSVMDHGLTSPSVQSALSHSVGNDAEVVSAFRRQLALSPLATERAYTKEVGRLLAWLLYAGYPAGSALATVNTLDMESYFAFLRSSLPLQKPDGRYWKRPAPLAASSLQHARSRLRVFFEKLETYETAPGVSFRSHNPITGLGRVVSARRSARQPGERVPIEGEEDQARALLRDDIQFVMESIEQMPRDTARQQAHYERGRWVFHLLYYTWLRISECARLQMGDFEFRDGQWKLYLWPSKHAATATLIDAFPPVIDALAQYRRHLRKLPHPFTLEKGPAVVPMVERWVKQAPIETKLSTGVVRIEEAPPVLKGMTERALFDIVRQVFRFAADRATGDMQQRLREASPHWLRHTGITHALNAGMDPRYVSRQARHQRISTTLGTYDHGPEADERQQQAMKLWTASRTSQ